MSNSDEMALRIEYLYKAIEDSQNTIRFTDTKASLLLVGLTIIATFMTSFCNILNPLISLPSNFIKVITLLLGFITLACFITSAFISFKAINPLSSPTVHIEPSKQPVKIPFYLFSIIPKLKWKDTLCEFKSSKLNYKIDELFGFYSTATENDIIYSLTYELAKVSYIREKKIFRVNKAIGLFKIGIILWLITSLSVLLRNVFS